MWEIITASLPLLPTQPVSPQGVFPPFSEDGDTYLSEVCVRIYTVQCTWYCFTFTFFPDSGC